MVTDQSDDVDSETAVKHRFLMLSVQRFSSADHSVFQAAVTGKFHDLDFKAAVIDLIDDIDI